jgi:hypothetical protein
MGYLVIGLVLLPLTILAIPIYLLANWLSPDRGQSPQDYDKASQHPDKESASNKPLRGFLTYRTPIVH